MRRNFLIACLTVLGIASPSLADLVTVTSSKDNTLYEDFLGRFSNGAGESLFSGLNGGGFIRRAVVQFDLSGVVPPGSTVISATLTMQVTRTQSGPQTQSLHTILADWGEGASVAGGNGGGGGASAPGDATWLHTFYDTDFWAAEGGDFTASPSASISVDGLGSYSWMSAQMASDVQAWVDNGATNFGWIVVGVELGGDTAKRYASREYSIASQRPELTVEFLPPTSTGACCMPDGSCLTMTSGDCALAGGMFQGAGVSCDPNPCPQPTGACCLPDGSCDDLTELDCLAMSGDWMGAGTDCMSTDCPLVPYVDALPIPAVAPPAMGSHYILGMAEVQQRLHRDLPMSTVWGYGPPNGMGGYDATFPGPTIEARVGQGITVQWVNDLRDLTTGLLRDTHYLNVDTCMHGPNMTGDDPVTVVHLHGGHVAEADDGDPDLAYGPGLSALYSYPNIQEPATLWYHDHGLGITRLNVYMGLAGFYLLRDDAEDALGLPSGAYEIPLVLQDRDINPDGTLSYPDLWQDHFFGQYILVNGKVWPFLKVRQGKYRFRLLNGSGSRFYTLALSNGGTIQQIGSDGGLLPAPVALTELTIGPGERADIVIDFAGEPAGTEILLTNSAPAPFPGVPGVGVVPEVMKFVVQNTAGHTDPLPMALRSVPPIPEGEAVVSRDFVLRLEADPTAPEGCPQFRWEINGLRWNDITEFPELGTAEIWRFINRSGITHPMHMHLVQFQVLDTQAFTIMNNEIVPVGSPTPPAPQDAGWKDTVQVMPSEMVRVIARFEDFTGQFPYHCHILEHEDHEMMRQFQVVAPCPEDLNDDGVIDTADLGILLGQFGTPGPESDLNGDMIVDTADLGILLGVFGTGCP
ncbi:MAG: multicopper oxidase domain-containing protein [Phycisphaeraceae bacterium]|nr:multicopper oxidase domain-containing protein [Phycisphaeraceae bacterium]